MMSVVVVLFAAVSLLFGTMSAASDACDDHDYGTAGDFDTYVSAQSWSAAFCLNEPNYPGCLHPTGWQRVNLSIHGLWPSYATTRDGHFYPQCCQGSAYALHEDDVNPMLAKLQLMWPDEQHPAGKPLTKSLWSHEVNKHGSCSQLNVSDYLRLALQLQSNFPTPTLLQQNIGGTLSLTKLAQYYPNNTAFFVCSDEQRQTLSEVRLCLLADLTDFMVCPETVTNSSDACAVDTVQITSFDSVSLQ
jgi:ribonuclease I